MCFGCWFFFAVKNRLVFFSIKNSILQMLTLKWSPSKYTSIFHRTFRICWIVVLYFSPHYNCSKASLPLFFTVLLLFWSFLTSIFHRTIIVLKLLYLYFSPHYDRSEVSSPLFLTAIWLFWDLLPLFFTAVSYLLASFFLYFSPQYSILGCFLRNRPAVSFTQMCFCSGILP